MPKVKYTTEHQKRIAKSKQQQESQKKISTAVTFRFHKEYDKDILDKLASVENKTGYLKELIRKDLKGEIE